MKYKAYKLAFTSGIHIGKTMLVDSNPGIHADTLFSALCQEALKIGGDTLAELYGYACDGKLQISDAFPYIGDICYLPNPMKRIVTESQGDSTLKKLYKKLTYIPADKLDVYLRGELDARQETNKIRDLGHSTTRTSAAVRGKVDTEPYHVGVYQFNDGNGLYIILGYEDEKVLDLTEMLLECLSYSGIGGRRSSGLGRFELYNMKVDRSLEDRLTRTGKEYMTLSVSLPQDDELEMALDGANYKLIKRSGFVSSYTYSEEYLRKKDLYVLDSGACVINKYMGSVYDVSAGGRHPVYRYAKPMFLEVTCV